MLVHHFSKAQYCTQQRLSTRTGGRIKQPRHHFIEKLAATFLLRDLNNAKEGKSEVEVL